MNQNDDFIVYVGCSVILLNSALSSDELRSWDFWGESACRSGPS
jgi:hypothetical protein